MARLSIVIFCFLFVGLALSCGDLLHAHCELYWNFENTKCTNLLPILVGQFKNCCLESSIDANYTHYTLTSVDVQQLTVTGSIHFSDGYIDDQSITLTQNGTDCSAYACSHSESLSYYDYDANFCDIHNIARVGIPFTEVIGDCRFHPEEGQYDSYCNSQ